MVLVKINTLYHTHTHNKEVSGKDLEGDFKGNNNLHLKSGILVTEEISSDISEEKVQKNYSIIDKLQGKTTSDFPSKNSTFGLELAKRQARH